MKHIIKQFKEIFWILQYYKDETLTFNLLDKLTYNSDDRLQLNCQTMSNISQCVISSNVSRQPETLFYNNFTKNAVT